ncbi:hypothetical protein K2173_026092 [Erythroxylum novogranatense]|uniref:Chorismate mutase n=1 Tax=Erythroxylum novogranatense TaxID=1862640 RepID=A0AAV8SHZ7_9ROSI|nr:hypothetical protein K2173_026092 [Erythroxylum novogranatense]
MNISLVWSPFPMFCGGMRVLFGLIIILTTLSRHNSAMADGNSSSDAGNEFNLDSIRKALIRQEDTIVFCLIERARFPSNSRLYNDSLDLVTGFSGSLVHFIIQETEAIQAKAGRYENPEENAFFPENLPPSVVSNKYPQVLHPPAASVNVSTKIWEMYFNKLLPLFVRRGDDGNFASTAASDLDCLQALSRRIHYGKFVAEIKFRDAPQEYAAAIRSKDRDALMKLLTFEKVEEMVKKRVEKKARAFGQEVTVGNNEHLGNFKVDPAVVVRLFDEWVMPFTKFVQVEYLLRRLD